MKKYYWMMGVYLACMFISAEIYSFVYDVEPNTHYVNEYISEVTRHNGEDPPISFQEWMDRQDQKVVDFWDRFGDGCDAALNPWYEPDWSTDNRCRD